MQVFRMQKSGYALSLLFSFIGIIVLSLIMLRIWPQISISKDPVSNIAELLWTQKLDLVPYIEFRLLYLVIFGAAMLIIGAVVALLSTKRVYLPGKGERFVVWYQCPFCKEYWRAGGGRALTHCPICRQLVHPLIAQKPGA